LTILLSIFYYIQQFSCQDIKIIKSFNKKVEKVAKTASSLLFGLVTEIMASSLFGYYMVVIWLYSIFLVVIWLSN